MTIITASFFILLFSTRFNIKSEIKILLFGVLGTGAVLTFLLGLFSDDRTYLSSLATSLLFILLSIHGYFFVRKEHLYIRFMLKFIVYVTSNLVLILYFIEPFRIYQFPGFESVSWNSAVGFLLYSSTLLSNYYGALIEKKDLPENFTFLNKKFVDFWFTISFHVPIIIILLISLLYFFDLVSTKSGMAMGLFFACLLPFPITYFIYRETVDWSVMIFEKNRKLFFREKDIHFQNELLQEFARITSHNLRGPVVGLSNLIDMATDDESTIEYKNRTFSLIKQKLPSLVSTIDSLAEFHNMIQNGEIEYKSCKVKDYFEEALSICRSDYESDKIKIITELNLERPNVDYPDVYLKNIFYNLVSNSIKYRRKGIPLKIYVSTQLGEKNETVLTFRDNGLGMDLKTFGKNIFHFGRSYHNFANSKGIGLFIVKNQLARLGDTIDVESEEGMYTQFVIKLNHDGKKELGYS